MADFMCEGLLLPLTVAFTASLWVIELIVDVIVNKIIERREGQAYGEQKARYKTCDRYNSDVETPSDVFPQQIKNKTPVSYPLFK